MVKWFRIHLLMQGTWVQSLVQEDPMCHRATRPVHTTPETRTLYSLCSAMRSHHNEKSAHRNQRGAPTFCN